MPPTDPPQNDRAWSIGPRVLRRGSLPLLMGIVNVTPDSFSDGGEYLDPQAAVDHALQIVADGADILDIGGESTRPYSAGIDAAEELRRVVPVIESLVRQIGVPLSIDTTKSAVARAALDAGATIVNDISGLAFDPAMIPVCRDAGVGIVCMHIRGTPQTMQDDPQYGDAVAEIREWLAARLAALEVAGIPRERVCLDPGVGFGKQARHNVEILSNVWAFQALGRPVLIGHSRKGFLGKILGRPVDERLCGTLGVSLALASQRVDILRVHDVRAHRDALLGWQAVSPAAGSPAPAAPPRTPAPASPSD